MQIVRGHELEFQPASHENPSDPGVLKKVLASKAQLLTGQVQMLNWSLLRGGKSFQPHYHEDMQEVFVIIHGAAKMQVDSQTVDLNAGDAVIIEPREIHQMENESEQDVVYLVFGIASGQDGKTVVVTHNE